MKKNKKSFLHGFTIAELLIGLLISMVVAAALVPIIGLKKIKSPLTKFHHGMAQCYYIPVDSEGNRVTTVDETTGDLVGVADWQLHYFYTDNNPNSTPSDTVVQNENFCTFAVPNADFYEIITIGAGGDGYSNTSGMYIQSTENVGGVGQTGIIHSDSRFQSDISNARISLGTAEQVDISAQLRDTINEWATTEQEGKKKQLYALYHLESPLGKGGLGLCHAEVLDACRNKNCNSKGENDCNGPFKYDNVSYVGNYTSEGELNDYERKKKSDVGAEEHVAYSNDDIDHSFYSIDDANEAKRWAGTVDSNGLSTDNLCWFFYHAKGYPSGHGYKLDPNHPLKLFLTGWDNITIENIEGLSGRQDDTYLQIKVTDIEGKNPEKYLKLTASEEGLSATSNGTGIYTSPSSAQRQPSKCESKGSFDFVTDQPSGPQEPCPDGAINTNFFIPSEYNPGAPGGTEDAAQAMCGVQFSKPKAGVITPLKEVDAHFESLDDFKFLQWSYSGPIYKAKFGYGGKMGEEKSLVFENIPAGKKLYLYPAKRGGIFSQSFVSTSANNLDALNKAFIKSASGADGTQIEKKFSIFLSEMPIPSVPLGLAKPNNRQTFEYLPKIEGVPKRNGATGLKGCTDTTCPGFGGNGVYLFVTDVPQQFFLKLINLTNNIEFMGERASSFAGGGTPAYTAICDDGETVPSTDFITNNGGSINAKYCKEKRHKGNPGAVIIIW